MAIYGYIKRFTDEEVDEAAVNLLMEEGCEYIYIDAVNRATDKRAEFDKMVNILGAGDLVIMGDLTKLFRTGMELKTRVKSITDCGANVKSVTHPWLNTFDTPSISAVFNGLIEFDKALLADRIKAGMEVARAKGVELGRPSADADKLTHAIHLYETGEYSVPEICRICDISKSTLYRALRKQNKVGAQR